MRTRLTATPLCWTLAAQMTLTHAQSKALRKEGPHLASNLMVMDLTILVKEEGKPLIPT